MRIAVDARALLAGRGVTRYLRRLLTALAEQFPDDDWHAFVPGRAPVEAPEGVTLHRHPLGGRAVFGAASILRPAADRPAVRRRRRRLAAGARAGRSRASALRAHDPRPSFEDRPGDFTRYERLWHRLARPGRLAGGRRARDRRVAGDGRRGRALARRRDGRPVWRRPPRPCRGARRARRRTSWRSARSSRARRRRCSRRARQMARGARPARPSCGSPARAASGSQARACGCSAAPHDDELASLYSGALALVMPSWLEGYGLPPLEAAALRDAVDRVRPAASTTRRSATTSCAVPRGDPVALAGALLRMEREPQARAELGRAARTRRSRR